MADKKRKSQAEKAASAKTTKQNKSPATGKNAVQSKKNGQTSAKKSGLPVRAVSSIVFICLFLLFLLLAVLQAVVLIATHTNSCIHDLLAKTVTVDLQSQMIFDSKEALIAYKEKVHAEKAAKAAY